MRSEPRFRRVRGQFVAGAIVLYKRTIRCGTTGSARWACVFISTAVSLLLPCHTHDLVAQEAGGGGGDEPPALVAPPLDPGDLIRISFWREPELSGDFPVDETGLSVLPILGSRSVVELPADALRARLLQEYGRHLRNQEVQITVLRRVSITGEVGQPGLYHVDPTMRLSDAIAMAGGVTSDGRSEDIIVLRGGSRILSGLHPTEDLARRVRSGDEILVPTRSWFSRHAAVLVGGVLSFSAILISRGF